MSISVSSSAIAIAQALIGVGAVAALAGAPPREGRMMILSLSGQNSAQIAAWASGHGARAVDAGPLSNSLVVMARAGDLAGAALNHGGIIVAAPKSGCGTGADK